MYKIALCKIYEENILFNGVHSRVKSFKSCLVLLPSEISPTKQCLTRKKDPLTGHHIDASKLFSSF